jgi:hypothetical protein
MLEFMGPLFQKKLKIKDHLFRPKLILVSLMLDYGMFT